jgi:O-antigen/teichoic acid export membrane protein
MNNLINKSRKNTYYIIVNQIIIKLIGFALIVVLTRQLSVDMYGVYELLIGSLMVFGFLCNFGVANSLQRFLPEYFVQKKINSFSKLINFALLFRFVLSLIVFGIVIIFFDEFSLKFDIVEYKKEFIYFSLSTVFLFQADYLTIALNSMLLQSKSFTIQSLTVIIRFLLVLSFFYFGWGLKGVFLATLIAYVVGWVLLSFFFMSDFNLEDRDEESFTVVDKKRVIRFSLLSSLIIPGNILFSTSMDNMIIAFMADTNDLGLYAFASRMNAYVIILLPTLILSSLIRPIFFQRYSSVSKNELELSNMFQTLVNFNLVILVPLIFYFYFTADIIIPYVFGDKYLNSIPILMVFLIFSLFYAFQVPCDLVLQAIEKLEVRFYAEVFAVYNLLMAIYLMNKIGVIGVAIATGSALMFKNIFYLIMVFYYQKITLNFSSFLIILINTFLSLVPLFLSKIYFENDTLILLCLFISMLLYCVLNIKNSFINNYERKLLNQLIKKNIF